jgi:hypothetical protein
VQVLTVMLLLDEDAPAEAPPELLPPLEDLPALSPLAPPPPTLMDELPRLALLPAWPLLELEVVLAPPPALDELLLSPPAPARPLELVELSDEPPEDLLLPPPLPPSPPPLSELFLDLTAQVIRKTAPARVRMG